MVGLIHPKDSFLIDQIGKFQEENPNLNLGFAAITGSDTYGFRSPDSDYDIRGVFYYDTKEYLKIFNDKTYNFNYSTVNKHDMVSTESVGKYFAKTEYRVYDFVFTEVKNFLKHINRMNCTTLEQLFSPMVVYCIPQFEKLRKTVSSNLASKGIYESYHGMAMFNYKHYIESDRKATVKKWLYVIRAYLAGIYALENGRIEQNMVELAKNSSALNGVQQETVNQLVQIKLEGRENKPIEEVTNYEIMEGHLLQLRDYLESYIKESYERYSLLPREPTEILKEYLDYWVVDLRESK